MKGEEMGISKDMMFERMEEKDICLLCKLYPGCPYQSNSNIIYETINPDDESNYWTCKMHDSLQSI